MIDANLQIPKEEGQVYEPLPKDVYQVELLDVTSEERPTFETKDMPKEHQAFQTVLSFQWVVLEGDYRGRSMWSNFIPASLYTGKNGKNKLYKIIEALKGSELTPEEETSMSGSYIQSLLTMQCRVSVEIKASKTTDNKFNNTIDWLKANAQSTPLTPEEIETATVKNDKEEETTPDPALTASPEVAPFPTTPPADLA